MGEEGRKEGGGREGKGRGGGEEGSDGKGEKKQRRERRGGE